MQPSLNFVVSMADPGRAPSPTNPMYYGWPDRADWAMNREVRAGAAWNEWTAGDVQTAIELRIGSCPERQTGGIRVRLAFWLLSLTMWLLPRQVTDVSARKVRHAT